MKCAFLVPVPWRPCSIFENPCPFSLSPVFLSYVSQLIIDRCCEQSATIFGRRTRSEDLSLFLPEVGLMKQLEVLCSQGMMRTFL